MASPLLARNVPLTANPQLNPFLSRTSLLGRILEAHEHIFVLCYRESCRVHTASGDAHGRRMWWPSAQRRVVVFDASQLDVEHQSILKWAGCDLPGRNAGRSGEVATVEPCTLPNAGGGADWRRTSKHRLAALLAHLNLISTAAKRNLSSVVILEADAVPTLAVQRLSGNRSHAQRVAQRMKRALASRPWKVLRLSGMFYTQEYAPPSLIKAAKAVSTKGVRRSCSAQCTCSWWSGSALTEAIAPEMRLCQTMPATTPSDTIVPMIAMLDTWCDVRDTAAYAVHRSAYATFTGYLERLRALPAWLQNGALDVPAIDNWIPHALPCLYVLPTLVTQPSTANDSQGATAVLRQKSAHGFLNTCVRPREEVFAKATSPRARRSPLPAPPRRRTMKLSSFATRHLYVMKVRP